MSKYSAAKRKEKREIGILENLLNSYPLLTQLTRGDDDFPLIDGYIHLLSAEEKMDGNMLKVQIKPLKTNKNGTLSVTCSVDLLNHAQESSLPILLIAVGVDEQVAYWSYLSPESIKPLYDRQTTTGRKTATLRLHKRHVIKSGVDTYIADWKRICLHHRNVSNDRLASRYKKNLRNRLVTANEATLLERINTLKDLVYYRTNEGEYPLAEVALEMSKFFDGTSTTVKRAYIELLEQLVHDKTKEVLEILVKLTDDDSDSVRSKAEEAIKDASKYNYHVLNTIGLGSYRHMFDCTKDYNVSMNYDLLRNLLNPDFEGTSQQDMYTIAFHRGPLDATQFLKDLRRDIIELLLDGYEKEGNLNEKKKIVETIGFATHKSDSPFPSDPDFLRRSIEMVEADTAFIVSAYEKIVFPNGKMTSLYPVVYEIESQLSRLNTRERKIPGVEQLLQRVRNDTSDYRLFSLLAGDEMRLRLDIEWREGEQIKEALLREIFDSINEENADEWYERIETIANFRNCIEDWLYGTLRDLLAQIAECKPKVAVVFAERALQNESGTYFFFRSILWGFRRGSIQQWDKYVSRIAKEKRTDQVEGILMSFFATGTELPLNKIRKKDTKVILEIASKNGLFSFLKSKAVNRGIEYHSFKSLTLLSTLSKEIRQELLEKIQEHPEMGTMFYDQMGFALHCKWIRFEEWNKEEIDTLAEMLTKTDRIDHNEMQVLHALGVVNFELMMSVFEHRIKHPYNNNYDAIPYHFEASAATFIRNNPKCKSIVLDWLKEMDPEEDSMVGYHLAEFFQNIGGEVLQEALSELVKTGTRENILKVLRTLPVFGPVDTSLCLEIVAVTDDKDILGQLEARMRHRGGGSGTAGENIFAREMRKNQKRIENAKAATTDPRVISFCERVLYNLERDIEESDRDHDQKMKERKEDFDRDNFID